MQSGDLAASSTGATSSGAPLANAGGEDVGLPESHPLCGHRCVDRSVERVLRVDRPWPGPLITRRLIDIHQMYIMWCYVFCRETEHETAWFAAHHFA